jgi:hypothetical protein
MSGIEVAFIIYVALVLAIISVGIYLVRRVVRRRRMRSMPLPGPERGTGALQTIPTPH